MYEPGCKINPQVGELLKFIYYQDAQRVAGLGKDIYIYIYNIG